MRAVIEYHGTDNVDLPCINVLIGKGNEDLTIQVIFVNIFAVCIFLLVKLVSYGMFLRRSVLVMP